jgi:hypothetical protein
MALTFPHDVELNWVYGGLTADIAFLTLVSQAENGAEQRRIKWSQGKRTFSGKLAPNQRKHLNKIWNFYQACMGRANSFNFTSPIASLLPYDQTTVWLRMQEGQGTKINDYNGEIYPTFTCRFLEDNLSLEEFEDRIQRTGLKIFQFSPLVYTNNYAVLSDMNAWGLCPDYSSCLSFNGSSNFASVVDCAALDVGVGDFSFAFAIYPNSLAAALNILSKKSDSNLASKGYNLVSATNGQITIKLSEATHQDTIVSAVGALVAQTWKMVTVTVTRSGNIQIYINNVASGSPVTNTATLNADSTNFLYLGRAEGIGYANCLMSNLLFAKKVWTQVERDLIWDTWRSIFGI